MTTSNQLPADLPIASLADALIDRLRGHRSVVVAFSGGVDSAVVAAAAHRALGDAAMAWTSIGPAVPESDRESARDVATAIGIRHVEFATLEMTNPDYVRNGPDRCYHCKSTLYSTLRQWADAQGIEVLLSGTNRDDLQDYRPGLQAAQEWTVQAPLAELGITKAQVRQLAEHWQLPVASKPASPCLSSRIAYGQIVTLGRLSSIETIETWLHAQGFRDVRARVHGEGLLRLELSTDELPRALEPELREALVQLATQRGFHFVTLDLAGRASGSLNRVLPTASLSEQPDI